MVDRRIGPILEHHLSPLLFLTVPSFSTSLSVISLGSNFLLLLSLLLLSFSLAFFFSFLFSFLFFFLFSFCSRIFILWLFLSFHVFSLHRSHSLLSLFSFSTFIHSPSSILCPSASESITHRERSCRSLALALMAFDWHLTYQQRPNHSPNKRNQFCSAIMSVNTYRQRRVQCSFSWVRSTRLLRISVAISLPSYCTREWTRGPVWRSTDRLMGWDLDIQSLKQALSGNRHLLPCSKGNCLLMTCHYLNSI